MRRILMTVAVLALAAGAARAETIRILMETVPDTRYIQELLPQFEEQSGIDVEIEAISYIDMHSKLVPQLISPQGSYDLIVVDFYWVGEFTKAGWLMPLDDLVARDGVDVSVYVPKLMDLVGRVNGVLYMLPFYNYSMAVIYRQDLLDDPAEQAAFKEMHGMDLKVPETWDEYWKQVDFFTRDNDGDGERDFFGTVIQGQRGDCISMQWANYLYSQGGRYHDENWNPLLDSPKKRFGRWSSTARQSRNTARRARSPSASTRHSTSWRRARRTASSPSTSCMPVSRTPSRRRWPARSASRPIRAAA